MSQTINKEMMSSTKHGFQRTLHKIQGNKFKLLPSIANTISKTRSDASSTWIEPFFGTGVVGFNLAPENAYFYDINPNIIGLYSAIKNRKLTLRSFTKLLNEHKKAFSVEGDVHYYRLRESFNESPDPLKFLILNRTGYNGLVRFSKRNQTFNVPYGKNDHKLTDTLIEELMEQFSNLSYKIKHNNWKFATASFEKVIKSHKDNKDAFWFCDPPYLGRDTQYFTSWDISCEERLFNAMNSQKGSFALTTWYGEYELIMNEAQGRYENDCKPMTCMPNESTNEAFKRFWSQFSFDTVVHKYSIAGAKKRVGVYEAIVYK